MSGLISAVASLLWPTIVLLLIVLFRRPIARVIRSAESREFTVKLGGQEVSFREVSRQQTDLITDLQQQLAGAMARLDAVEAMAPRWGEDTMPPADADRDAWPDYQPAPGPGGRVWGDDESAANIRPSLAPPPAGPPWPGSAPADGRPAGGAPVGSNGPSPSGVLWVDDHPENHAVQTDWLERNRIPVDIAVTTQQALRKLSERRYRLIVSDMARTEDGRFVDDAGLALVRAVRDTDGSTPIALFTSRGAVSERGAEALAAGANVVTGSGYELQNTFRQIGLA